MSDEESNSHREQRRYGSDDDVEVVRKGHNSAQDFQIDRKGRFDDKNDNNSRDRTKKQYSSNDGVRHSAQRRYDSDEEGQKAVIKPQTRYDSDDDVERAPKPAQRRYDSDDDNKKVGNNPQRRYDSDKEDRKEVNKSQVRYDSDEDVKRAPKRLETRYDSDEDVKRAPNRSKGRYDSDEEVQRAPKTSQARNDREDEDVPVARKKPTASDPQYKDSGKIRDRNDSRDRPNRSDRRRSRDKATDHSRDREKRRRFDDRHETTRYDDRRHDDSSSHRRGQNDSRRDDTRRDDSRDRRRPDRNSRDRSQRPRSQGRQENPRDFSKGKKEVWGNAVSEAALDTNDSSEPPVEKQKADFGLSGALAKDAATGNLINGVLSKYSEPLDAAVPTKQWRFYVFKGDEMIETLYIHRKSYYMIGRDNRIADIVTSHESCSKQHAVIQYREIQSKDKHTGDMNKVIKPYLLDLGTPHKTFLNNQEIEAARYYEVREKDVMKFGASTRDYVLLHGESNKE